MLAVVLAEVADGALDAKGVALLGVLAAAAAALRPFGSGHAGFEPMWIVVVLGGRALGPGFGFCLGAVGMFASALVTGGVGPWLPFQMLGAAWIGLGAGLLPRADGRRELGLLAAYSAVVVRRLRLPAQPVVLAVPHRRLGLPAGAVVRARARPWPRTCSTGCCSTSPRRWASTCRARRSPWRSCCVAGRPVLLALRRASRRAAFDAPVVFDAEDVRR